MVDVLSVQRKGNVYVHIPFCARWCSYCPFYSEPADKRKIERFISSLITEMEMLPSAEAPETLYFGGGTPSILSVSNWIRIFNAFEKRGWSDAAEFTIECNPATVTESKARVWREHGVNRVSVGVQAFDDATLRRLGRVHSVSDVIKTIKILRNAGFDNLNLDLMFAIPGQSRAAWRRSLCEAIAIQPEHISCYEITFEEDTELFDMLESGGYKPDEDVACDMYEDFLEYTANHGYELYEVSNTAKHNGTDKAEFPFFACRHNINYWRGGSYHGLGPSAAGYANGVRTRNLPNTDLYCAIIETGRRAFEYEERLSPPARAGETAAFGLRMAAGWPLDEFRKKTGYGLLQTWPEEIRMLVSNGLGILESDRFRLTPRGLRTADWVATQFLCPAEENIGQR
ncbi:MAG: radical SAM family heme chaperone HemW [Verrucomicrobia bacterium]|nr:radical SAM family heme chaperone HemW [Verrucomicrobiota bacterium]